MKKLSAGDMVMLMLDSPRCPNHMGPVLICEGGAGKPEFADVLLTVGDQLNGIPMLRRRLVEVPLGLDNPYWVDDPNFDLEFHVREASLPAPGGWKQLRQLISQLCARPLDLRRPPWELYVVDGLNSVPGAPSGSFAVFIKIHHTAVDGQEGVQLLTALTSSDPEPPAPEPRRPWEPLPLPSSWNMLWRSLADLPRRPAAALRLAGNIAPALGRAGVALVRTGSPAPSVTVPYTRFSGPVGPHRSTDAVRLDFQDVKEIRGRVPGATVNDVALAIVGGGLRRYLAGRGELPPMALSAAIPISTRVARDVGSGGNHIDNTRVSLCTDIATDLDRLAEISGRAKNIRTVRSGVSADKLAAPSDVVPGQLLGGGVRAAAELAARARISMMASVTVTNVPGPRVPLYFMGRQVLSMYGIGPIQDGMGLIHLAGTYCDEFTISVVADREMLPDMDSYTACLCEAFDGLCIG